MALDNDLEIRKGRRTPFTPQSKMPFFPYSFISSKDEYEEVQGEMVYPFSAKNCFQIMKDYRYFLLSHLKGNELDSRKEFKNFCADPEWICNGDDGKVGTVGALCEYAYDVDGIVYWMVDKIVLLDEGSETDVDGKKIYRFGMETQYDRTRPRIPMRGHGTRMIFTTYNNDPNQCHLLWVRRFRKPVIFGMVSLVHSFKNDFQGYMGRDLQSLWECYHTAFSDRLPKENSKVLVIGAGPSGLHMSYLLINRGLDPKNITFLEKDSRYGGKTLSIEDKTNVQIRNPKYNPPPPRGCKEAAYKWARCKTLTDLLQYVLSVGSKPTAEELALIKRDNTPNALQYKEDYFKGGEEIFHELGTCYLSPGYYAIRSLLKEVQMKVQKRSRSKKISAAEREKWSSIALSDITREVAPDTYAIESANWDGAYTLPQWVFESGKEHTILDNILCCCPSAGVDLSVLNAKLKYCKLHEDYLGQYYYTLPPKPLDADMKKLVVPFGAFLADNGLETLVPLFTYALTAQGYGIVSETPTFLAMQWLTPDLLDGYFEWYIYFGLYKDSVGDVVRKIPEKLKKFNNPRKGMLVSGWGGLWDRIVDLYDLGRPDEDMEKRIKYNVEDINSIDRFSSDKIKIQYVQNGHTFNEEYDFLVVAAPPSDVNADPTIPTLNLDYTDEEKRLFLTKDLKAGKFRTTLFKPDKNGPYEKDHLRIFIDNIQGNNAGFGGIFGVRDSYKAIQPRLSTVGGNEYDPRRDQAREKMCYQYVSPANKIPESDLSEMFTEFMLKNNQYVNDGTTKERVENEIKLHEKSWTYYSHYETKGLLSGKLWDIMDIQGKNKTLFVHATTSFESVLDIVNYNNMILDGLGGKLDDLIPPTADTRPEVWQRPQYYLLNQAHYYRRLVLNFILTIIWTIWYIVSWPLAEGFYLRIQRYNLQKAFKTPDLGNPWDYNMTKFINVSPTTRGYMDYLKGKPNGIPNPIPNDWDPYTYDKKLGPGDTVFKILQAPMYGFPKKFPAIPDCSEIYSSMQWNLTDFRMGIRYWLTTFEDTFQPLLGSTAQAIINSFSAFFPNYYSWIFSWIFASQFRLLIGYSLRFEDEKGGGLYIPDCKMLRTAIKDHGVEVGQRICLTVCKLFTEEVMRSKQMVIDFQPEFVKKSGYGCTVRMYQSKEHAFSNHSLYNVRTNEEREKFQNVDLSW